MSRVDGDRDRTLEGTAPERDRVTLCSSLWSFVQNSIPPPQCNII